MEQDLVSLDEPSTGGVEAPISLNDQSARVIDDKVAAKRATKADYGLGELSPGRDALANSVSAGTEETLRATASAQREMKETAAAAKRLLSVATKTTPVTQDDVDLVQGQQARKPIDPGVIFEIGYGERIVTDISAANPDSSSVHNKATAENPQKAYANMDAASEIIAKGQIVQTLLENKEADYKASPWSVGAVSDIVELAVPLLGAYRTHDIVEQGGSFLPGSNMEQQVQALLLMPPAEMKTKLEEVTNTLYDQNPLEAIRFLKAVQSFSADDRFIDNMFAVGDAIGVGELASAGAKLAGRATKMAPKLAAETTADIAVRQQTQAMKTAVKAAAKNPDVPEDIFAAVGQVQKAAEIGAIRKLGILPTDGMTDLEILRRILPSAAKVDNFLGDAGTLSREATDRLAAKLKSAVAGLDESVEGVARNIRLNPEQLAVAVEEGKAALRREFEKSSDSIIDIRHNVIDDNKANVETLTLELGAPAATPFPTEDLARFYANDVYGLTDESYKVKQVGDSFTLEVTRPLDETTEGVRNAAIVTANADNSEGIGSLMDFLKAPNQVLPGYLKGADESLSEFQNANRKATQYGFNQTLAQLKEIVQPIASLGKKEQQDLGKVLAFNRDSFNTNTGDRGFFYETVADLEDGYQRVVGRLPAEAEIQAYYNYVQLSDLDWGIRNYSLYRDKARLGLKQYDIGYMKVDEGGTTFPRTPRFDGKEIDNLPWKGEEATVLHFEDGGKSASVFSTKEVDPNVYEDMILNKGYKVIQVDNPVERPFADVLQNREVIQYVLTKEYKQSELPLKQLDYNPGGHVEYQHDWFIKQPNVSVGRRGLKFYEGDTAVLNFSTEAQTRKFERNMNEARIALKAKDDVALAKAVDGKLPWTVDEFKSLFKGDDGLSIDQKFHVVRRGRNVIDDHKYIRSENPGIRDYTDSSHNLSGEANRKYVGARNGPLMTVRPSGSDSNPVLRLAPAKLIDPLQTMGRSLSNAVNNRFFGDYKIGAVEDFITRYADAMKTPKQDLENFPMYFLHHPEWDEGSALYGKVAEAKNARRAIMNFVGEQTTLGRHVENVQRKLANSIFNTLGESVATKFVEKVAGKSGDSIDPAGYFRAVGFHTKLGLFNPMQYPLQAMGAAHAIALSPKHGLNAAISYFPTRWLGLNPSEEAIKVAAVKMKAFGWEPEHFAESVKTMRSVGYDNVGREHVWKDNISDPKVFANPGGGFLDKGSFFFNEGERTNRIVSWHTAYREWKEANPLRSVNQEAVRQILNRADLLGLNMTRASAAAWQKGALSIPTQFLAYNARLMDQFLGKRLTVAEKARAFGLYSTLYGVPSGAAALTGYTAYEDIRTAALERGWPIDNGFFKALHEGVLSTTIGLVTGTDYNVADRYGPGGLKQVRDILRGDKTFGEIVGGASGSIIGDIVGAGSPFFKDVYSVFKEGGSYEPVIQDVVDATRNISSVNNTMKTIMALNTGKYFTKTGRAVGDMTGSQAIVNLLTGLQPQEFTDMNLKRVSMQEQQKLDQEVYKEWSRQMKLGFEAPNEEAKGAFYRKARAALIAGDVNPAKQSLFMQRFLKDYGDQIDRIDSRFVQDAPASQFDARNTQRNGQ